LRRAFGSASAPLPPTMRGLSDGVRPIHGWCSSRTEAGAFARWPSPRRFIPRSAQWPRPRRSMCGRCSCPNALPADAGGEFAARDVGLGAAANVLTALQSPAGTSRPAAGW
jgi:hypothetical protein